MFGAMAREADPTIGLTHVFISGMPKLPKFMDIQATG
jgi:hypothetical protein